MPNLNKPLSVRVSDKDMAFLSEYAAGDAVTPSEKIRALIQEARLQKESYATPDAAHRAARSILAPTICRIYEAEKDSEMHSELLSSAVSWAEDLISELLMLPSLFGKERQAALLAAEAKVTARLVLMIDRILRYGLTRTAPAYNPEILHQHLSDLEEILEMLAMKRNSNS